MTGDYQVLVDSDAWVGWMAENDPHHQRAVNTFERLKESGSIIVTTSAVEGETATVLSYKYGAEASLKFLDKITTLKVPIIHIDQNLHNEALALFMNHSKRGTSYVDCTNLAVMATNDIPRIFSFDSFYFKDFGLKPV